MFGPPWYYNYPANTSYNPHLHSPYQRASPSQRVPVRDSRAFADEEQLQERSRVLAERRARRARYLPDEDEASDDDWEYNQLGPRQHAYLGARRKQEMLERMQREDEARQRAVEEQKWQEGLETRHKEDKEVRQRLLEEKRRQIQQKREEETQRLAALERERKTQLQQQEAPHEDHSIPINVRRTATTSVHEQPSEPSTKAEPAAAPRSPSPKAPVYGEGHQEAATRIQKRFRVHLAHRTLDDIASQFQTLTKGFVYPSVIDFQKPGTEDGHISVPAYRPPSDFDVDDSAGAEEGDAPMDVDGTEGKLAYTSLNFPLHAYFEAMDKLLMKLDEVESWGRKGIRERRRGIVKEIEKEAAKLERYWKQAWRDYVEKQAKQTEVQTSSSEEPIEEAEEAEQAEEKSNGSVRIQITSRSDPEPKSPVENENADDKCQ